MAKDSPLLSERPLPDRDFSLMERGALALVLTAGVLLLGAMIGAEAAPGNALSEVVETYFLSPHSEDTTTGDADYNVVDTAAYSILLVSFVVLLSAWLRRLGVPPRDSTLLALMPWVVWAAFGEVNEDAGLFGTTLGGLFVSPLRRCQIAGWVVLTGWLSHRVSQSEDIDGRRAVSQTSAVIILLQAAVFLPDMSAHWDWSWTSPLLWVPLAGLVLAMTLHPFLSCCSAMEQGLLQTGLGGCAVHLAGWMAMYCEPLAHSSPISMWPMLLVVGAPALVCLPLYLWGRSAAADLHHMGLEPGIIPRGITAEDWDRQRSSTHERMEALTPRAVLGLPVVLLAMYGQMVDGLATSVGVEWYGYSEKHVLSEQVIRLGDSAYAFGLLKLTLAAVIWWMFATARFERRHLHLRLLFLLCLLVVGLAPGLRDVLRMTLLV